MKIAIVEDDINLAISIGKKIKKSGYEIVIVNTFENFKKYILDNADLFIIDLDLGKSNGFKIIKWLRNNKNSYSPIIAISQHNDIEMKLKGFTIGIDDFVNKNIDFRELLARIAALFRRGTKIKGSLVLYKNYIFDFELKETYKKGKRILLTRKEQQIVEYFLLNKERVVKKDELIKSVWGNLDLLDVTHNTINVTIYKIRKKLGQEFKLETLIGIGYILN
ncbi:MAG: response regulator transcription factor [Candidatus Gracilibacteria bacterium]